MRSNLNEGGVPNGYTPKMINLSLDCQSVDGHPNIDYTFQSASGSSGDYLLTSLAGLGIGFMDGNDNPLGLGINNSVSVPLQDSSTSFYLKPYPVRLAGQTVDNGEFVARAIITVSLP
ncbi:fimbrial protein [Aeromonas intestinalis]